LVAPSNKQPASPLLPTPSSTPPPGNYDEYFGMNTDVDAVVYLMLVNNVLHDLFPHAITIGARWAGGGGWGRRR
jgi:hypothetical protein